MTSLDHINPTEREAALIEQYNKAVATVASVAAERDRLQAELSAFHTAMERERKPDWEKWHNDLADRLENLSSDRTVAVDDARTAARELRYMAEAFTHKANFVPAELKIKELEAERDNANRDARAAIVSLNEASKFAAESILKLTNEREALRQLNIDACADDIAIRDLCRPIIGALKCDGDSMGVPTPVDVVETALQQIQGEAEEMRQELFKIYESCIRDDKPHVINTKRINALLESQDSGKALLARLEEARWLLEQADHAYYPISNKVATSKSWQERRHAWLKEGR